MAFASAIEPYWAAGWRGILPVPATDKHPPPPGYTGAEGIDTDAATLAAWSIDHANHSVALRIPRGMIAIDVDHYDKGGVAKRGGFVLADLEYKLGHLPKTWVSTSRGTDLGVGPSRTLFFRCPDQRYRTKLEDIEILQFHHRYCVVWPSKNPHFHNLGYRWYCPEGMPADRVPKVDELPWLPDAWVEFLAEGAASAGPASAPRDAGEALLAQLMADDRPLCTLMDSAAATAVAAFTGSEAGGRHDMATERTKHVVSLAAEGHTGGGEVLGVLGVLWGQLTAGEGREDEFERMLVSAARKAVTAIGSHIQVRFDPCAMGGHARYFDMAGLERNLGHPNLVSSTPVPPDPDGETPAPEIEVPAESIEPVSSGWSVAHFIGTYPFTPDGVADQHLAHQAWARIWPALRYGTDAGMWLVRKPDVWVTRNAALNKWAAAVLADLMPTGDPNAEKGSERQLQAVRRAKFATNGSAGSIADKMATLVLAGDHPGGMDLGECDTARDILWAGGVPWDLRRSADVPTAAAIDYSTPHLRTAAVVPAVIPTPYWDDFLAAVWPDPEVRAYALRVLSIGLTGHADAALPILLGDSGRGKTQVIELLMSVLGTGVSGYGLPADPRLLAATDNTHASIIIALMGRRLAFIDEGPRAGTAATERLKQLTGGGQLTGNYMGKNPVAFSPTHTLVLTTNTPPDVTDPAVQRRVRLLPCDGDPETVYVTRAALEAHWRAEQPGVLAAMMAEAGRWLADRRSALTTAAPLSIQGITAELAKEQDLVQAWIDAEMASDEWGTKSTELYALHTAWRRSMSGPNLTLTMFGKALTRLGYPLVHRNDGNYRGLRHKHATPGANTPASYTDETGAHIEKINQYLYSRTTPETGVTELIPGPAPQMRNKAENPANGTSADAEKMGANTPHHTPQGVANTAASAELTTVAKAPTSPPEPVRTPPIDQAQRETITNGNSASADLAPNGHLPVNGLGSFDQGNGISPDSVLKQPQQSLDVAPGAESALTASGERLVDGSEQFTSQPFTGTDQPIPPNSEGLKGSRVKVGERSNKELCVKEPHSVDQENPKNPGQNGRKGSLRSPHDPDAKPRIAAPKRSTTSPDKIKEREAAKIAKAAEREAAKAAEVAARIAAAAGPILDLPAAVSRVAGALGEPEPLSLSVAIERVRTAVARDGGRLTVDVESSGYPIGHRLHELRSVQLGDLMEGVYFDPADPDQRVVIMGLIAEAPILQAFSATADLAPLAHAGLIDHDAAWAKMHDIVIASKLNHPAGVDSDASDGLKALAPGLLGHHALTPGADEERKALAAAGEGGGWLIKPKLTTEPARNSWYRVPTGCRTMVRYAVSDVLDTAAVARAVPDPGEAMWERERTVGHLVGRIALRGVPIDGEHARMLEARNLANQAQVAQVIAGHGIANPNSNQQVAARLIELGAALPRTKPSTRYPTGQWSVAEDALTAMRNAPGQLGELVSALLVHTHNETGLKTFIRPYVAICDHLDGRARPTFYTMEADTGRMSCVRPNFQNVPREGGYRKMIVADPGHLLISADFSGVELRVAAALSGDRHLVDIILADDAAKAIDPKAKSDIHWKIAQQAYGPNATKPQRYNTKRGVFGTMYGSGIAGVARTLGIPESEAELIIAILNRMAPTYRAWDAQLRQAVRNGAIWFPTYAGRVIHLDKREPHKAGNYCIQGTARELLVDALIKWNTTKWAGCTLFPVHDEIVVMVPEDQAPQALETLIDCMRSELHGVPILAASGGIERYWVDAA